MAICAAPMFVNDLIMVFRGMASGPLWSSCDWAYITDWTPHMLVPWTTPQRSGSGFNPDCAIAC